MESMKGFFLSTDSIMSLLIVIGVIALLSFNPGYKQSETKAFEISSQNMHDISVIGFYTQKNAAALGAQDTLPVSSENARCKQEIISQVEGNTLNSTPDYSKEKYCEGFPWTTKELTLFLLQ